MAGCQYVHGKEDDAKIGFYLNLYPGVFCTGMDQSQEFWTSEIPGFNLTENTLIGQPR